MLLDSARGLKQALTKTILDPLAAGGLAAKGFALPAEPVAAVSPVQPSIALGISPHGSADFRTRSAVSGGN